MPAGLKVSTVVIAQSASLSGLTDVGWGRIVALRTPAAWTAADITLQGSEDGVNFANIHPDTSDTEYTIQAGASRYIILPVPLGGIGWLKVRSGTSGSPVNQEAARSIQVIVEKYGES